MRTEDARQERIDADLTRIRARAIARAQLQENRVNSISEEFISPARVITSEKNGSGIIGRMLNYRES